MRTSKGFVVVLALLPFVLSSATSASGTPGPQGRPSNNTSGAVPPQIVNRVIDLLNQPVSLEQGTDHETWQSASFDTAQFNVIIVKPGATMTSGVMDCQIAWQLGPDDGFVDPLSYSDVPTAFLLEGDSPVRGTGAKVFCHPVRTAFLGDDPAGGFEPGAGTLTDVKVLLRRK